MYISGVIVELSKVESIPEAELVRNDVTRKVGRAYHLKKYPEYEWQRLCYAFSLIDKSGTLLEVGPGRGYLANMLAIHGGFIKHVLVDIVELKNPKRYHESITYLQQSITELDDPDNSYDTVICMEVLEHLKDDIFYPALTQLRRVCNKHLIMSVPLCEPTPLPHYHHQQFDTDRIINTFPNARFHVLLKSPVTRVPWLLIEESF